MDKMKLYGLLQVLAILDIGDIVWKKTLLILGIMDMSGFIWFENFF